MPPLLHTLKAELPFLAGLITTLIFYSFGSVMQQTGQTAMVAVDFIWLFGVMLWSSFAVVRHADALAIKLGEPYGTLILTLSVIGIEVSLIAAMMLHGDNNPTLARDTMLAVLNIVLNGMVGLSLLLGGLKFGEQYFNTQGARTFLCVILPLATISLILPSFTTTTQDASLSFPQELSFALIIIALYGLFLLIQTNRHRHFFLAPQNTGDGSPSHEKPHVAKPQEVDHAHDHHDIEIHSLTYHGVFLLLTMLPIVLLSKKLAVPIDLGIATLNAPAALGGVLVAILVLTPEGLGSFKAALHNQLQRSINICLGSALATIGLTVPCVLLIDGFLGRHIILGLDPRDIVMLTLTMVLSLLTFSGTRTNMLHGAIHLVLFAVYFILLFNP